MDALRAPDVLCGIALMVLGVSMFPFMNAAVKLLTAHYPVMQIVWARFTGHLIVMLVVFLPRHGRRLLATRRLGIQLGRSLLMLVSNLVFVMAIGTVPLATASAIGFTSPFAGDRDVGAIARGAGRLAALECSHRGVCGSVTDHSAGDRPR